MPGQVQTISQSAKPQRSKYNPAIVDRLLQDPNLSQSQVAKLAGVHPSAITRYIQAYGPKKAEYQRSIQNQKANLSDAFQEILGLSQDVQALILTKARTELETDFDSIPWSAKNGLLANAINLGGNAYDKYRIETGQSVPNSNSLPIQEVTNNIQVNIGKLQALGVDVADLVGKIAGDVRDKAVGLGQSSLNIGDKLGSNVSS